MMNTKKYIVWDWNGTLLDDVDLCIDCINRVLKKEGVSTLPDRDAYQRVFQFPIIEYYKNAGLKFDERSFEELADEYMAYYQPSSLHCPLYLGSDQVLQKMQDAGYHQFLLSASKLDFLHEQLAQYKIKSYFDQILGLDNIHAFSKKNLAYHFIHDSALPKESVVFIGDSVHDFEVAQYAGCESILIANGHQHKEKLLQTGSEVVDTIEEAAELLIK